MSLCVCLRGSLALIVSGAAGALWTCCGCASEPTFPPAMEIRPVNSETVFAFDTDGDERADFWQFQRSDGRKHALAYATSDSSEPDQRIELGAIDATRCPHFVIALDGVPFELVDELYQQGHFRFFYPPSRVICCFPAMTDLCLADLFHAGRCRAYQALHFDRKANRVVSGNTGYVSASNSPWASKMDYRCSFWWDAKAYLDPQGLFEHELRGIVETFSRVEEGEASAYSVGTAGLGTRGGRAAILEYLRTIDRLCEQIIFERRGRVQLTLTADHGHNLVENRRISFTEVLKADGYRKAQSLRGPRDVVPISYGLVTYAAFFTSDPAGVANCLVKHEDVEFACYPTGDEIVVCDRAGRARITRGADGFAYDASAGDPLKLAEMIEELRSAGQVSAEGVIDDAALFRATVEHTYPDPLRRIWGAFHELVENPPDVIVNLRDGACHGSKFFHFMIRKVTSTHGSLNRMNCTTFALTTLGELPAVMRASEVLPALEKLRSER